MSDKKEKVGVVGNVLVNKKIAGYGVAVVCPIAVGVEGLREVIKDELSLGMRRI